MFTSTLEPLFIQLLDECNEKIHRFQQTGYSFEEWFNWELYDKLLDEGIPVIPKPLTRITKGKSIADLLIQQAVDGIDIYIEVKLVHDQTTNKWLDEIEKDRTALINISKETSAKGLQLLLLVSSYENVLHHNNWKPWLEKLSFWTEEPTIHVNSRRTKGSVMILGWMIG